MNTGRSANPTGQAECRKGPRPRPVGELHLTLCLVPFLCWSPIACVFVKSQTAFNEFGDRESCRHLGARIPGWQLCGRFGLEGGPMGPGIPQRAESSLRLLPPPRSAGQCPPLRSARLYFEVGDLICVPLRLSAVRKQCGQGAESRVGSGAALCPLQVQRPGEMTNGLGKSI